MLTIGLSRVFAKNLELLKCSKLPRCICIKPITLPPNLVRHCSIIEAIPLRPVKGKSRKNEVKRFVDWQEVRVEGGRGGDGRISFLSIFAVEFAGPDGGNGGNGGHVIFTASKQVRDLARIKAHIRAEDGTPGKIKDMDGKEAKHNIVKVPVGTIIRNAEGEIVCDLKKDGAMFLAAKGGAGGKGNAHFKSAINQAPKVAEAGAQGEYFLYSLELRTIADVGLIGFPNAGKSTLLQAISRARPKVASYPFTTLNPHIGMVPYSDLTQLAVADLPGLLPGASHNHGLGYAFLRHAERCRLLLYVIDMSRDDPPLEQLQVLQHELNEYSPGLGNAPSAIIANKLDLEESRNRLNELNNCDIEVLPVSGRTGLGLTRMLTRIKQMKEELDQKEYDPHQLELKMDTQTGVFSHQE